MRIFLTVIYLLISQYAFAQKVKLPFVFLNQYFEYDVSEVKKYKIGDKIIDWTENLATVEKNKLKIGVQPIMQSGQWNILIRDAEKKKIFSLSEVDFNTSDVFKLPDGVGEKSFQICLSSRNKITQFLMCKSLQDLMPKEGFPKVLIDKKMTKNFGRVILNQPKKNILFEIMINDDEFIKMSTRKRHIIPSTVRKNAEQKTYEIKFVDIEQDNYAWVTSVGYTQEGFEIPNDHLIKVYQDYFNKDYSSKELNLEYYIPPYRRMRILNMYSFSPYFGFSKFEGNTQTKNVSILTEYDLSFRTYMMKQMPKGIKFLSNSFHFWTVSANLRSLKYISSANSITVANPGAFLYNISGSLNRFHNEKISYALRAAVEKNTSLDYISPSSSQVNMSSVLNTELGLQGTYSIFDHGHFVSFLHAGYSVLFPTEISGYSSKMGSRMYFRSDLHYAEGNKLYGIGFHYNIREQETDVQKFKDQVFDYTASYSVAF